MGKVKKFFYVLGLTILSIIGSLLSIVGAIIISPLVILYVIVSFPVAVIEDCINQYRERKELDEQNKDS